MTDTKELEVNGGNEETTDGNDAKPRASRHAKTESLQMLEAHAVEEALLEPLCFGKFIVKCPCLLCVIMMLIVFIVIIIDAQVFELSEQSNRTFLVEGNKYVNAFDAYNLATQFIADSATDNATVLPQTVPNNFWIYQHMFTLKDYADDFDINDPDKTDYWILTPENIEIIIKWEDAIMQDPEWKDRFCYVGPDPLSTNYSCQSFPDLLSMEFQLARMADPEYWPEVALVSAARMVYNDPNYDNMTTDDIKDWFAFRASLDGVGSFYASFFNPGLKETGQTYVYRSFFYPGMPIATESDIENGTRIHGTTYKNALDNEIEQEQEYIDWATDLFVEVTVNNNGDFVEGNLNLITVSWTVYSAYFNVLLQSSMGYLIFAIVIVLCYMSIHLGSVILAISALFQILMSFPLAYFFYRIVFQIPHYDTLSSLIIFVLLGVGADDVFVFTDAWLQSTHFVKNVGGLDEINESGNCWENDKVSCIKKDTKRLILRMSFAFRRAAKAMLVTQVTTFFAFLATATSAIMPIAAFGIWAATIVAMNYVLVITVYPAILIFHHAYLKKFENACLCFVCNLFKRDDVEPEPKDVAPPNDADAAPKEDNVGDMMPELQRQLTEEEQQSEEYRCFEQFLGRKWSKFINKYKVLILIVFTILFIIAAITGSQIEAQSEDEKWFADEHYMQKAQDKAGEFSASETDNLVIIQITFGIEGVDREGTTRWNPMEYGQVVFDDTFDISSSAAQIALMDICETTRNSELVYQSESTDTTTCPIEDFRDYLEAIGDTFPYQTASDKKSFGETYFDFMNSPFATQGVLTFVEKDEETGKYEVRFYAMNVYTSITWNAPSDESRDYRAKWDEFIEDFSADCPDSVCNSMGNVALRWCWLVTQQAFVQSAVQGILIAMPLAFIILIISTQNWVISVFAIFDIVGIMLCELGIMYAQGWKFGVSESVAIVIIIGFSVDYVVHLANAYLESTATDRQGRLSFALLTMGISVVSGAITTFGAGFFLIFPEIVFFYKMGVLMMTTVAVSIIWAMCFFTSIVAMWGPQNDTGDLKKLLRCCPCFKKKDDRVLSMSEGESYRNYKVSEGEFKPYKLEMTTNGFQE